MRKLIIFITVFLAINTSYIAQAQVTIGSQEVPAAGALLDLKEFNSTELSNATSTRGLMLPRLNLEKRKELIPMLDAALIGTDNYENVLKKAYTGSMVYNVNRVPSEYLRKGIYTWTGAEWISIGQNDRLSNYSVDCSKTKVYGIYAINAAANNSNYVEVTINTLPEEVGSFYEIQTQQIHGLSFAAKGKITSTTQIIKLKASGTPKKAGMHHYTIQFNNEASSVCTFSIEIAYPRMRIVGIGDPTYNAGHYVSSVDRSGLHTLLSNPAAFGTTEESIVKTNGFYLSNAGVSEAGITQAVNQNPDIIILGYPVDINTASNITLLKNYVAQGGVLLAFLEGATSPRNLTRAIFDDNNIGQVSGGGAGTVNTFEAAASDPIGQGPFGNINGKYWGEDASTTRCITNLPAGKATVYSTRGGVNNAAIFKHNTLNFFFVGDGGFNSRILSGSATEASFTAFPFRLNPQTLLPEPKPYTNASTRNMVYNSTIFANVLAWAIDRAYTNGINSAQWKTE